MTRVVANILVCVFLATAAAQAGITTSNVKVVVTGKHCGELKDVFLVIGDDLEDRWVKLDPDGACHWKTNLGDTISTSIAKFSLRAGLGRFGCQMAAANKADMSADLEFSCCVKDTFRNVRLTIEPPMPVSYTRDVRPFPEDRIHGIRCLEYATFAEGRGAISNALFKREDVYLHLGQLDWKRQTPGLLLNDIVVDHGVLVLTREGVVYRLMVQRAKGKMRSAPTTSSNAISLDIRKLGELKFERAEFKVIK